MFITLSKSVYTREYTHLTDVTHPQYGHQLIGNPIGVRAGTTTVTQAIVDKLLTPEVRADIAESIDEQSVAFILAAGNLQWTGYDFMGEYSDAYPTLKVLPMGIAQIYAGFIANRLGKFNHISTDATSCISAHVAWEKAYHLLNSGSFDKVVVLAVDNGLSEEFCTFFHEQGITGPDSFYLAQGANITVLEASPHREPVASVDKIITVAEHAKNPLGIGGSGYREALLGVMGTGIEYVKAHATGTTDNKIENVTIHALLGDIPVITYKQDIGHTLGASTAIETEMAIKEHGGTFISLGAGMGNVYSAACIRAYE